MPGGQGYDRALVGAEGNHSGTSPRGLEVRGLWVQVGGLGGFSEAGAGRAASHHRFSGWSSWGRGGTRGTVPSLGHCPEGQDKGSVRAGPSDSLLRYEDAGPDLVHLVPGRLLAVSDQRPLQVQDAGRVVQAAVVHLLPHTVVQVLHQQLLGGLQQAGALGRGLRAPRLQFWGDRSVLVRVGTPRPPGSWGQPTPDQCEAGTPGVGCNAGGVCRKDSWTPAVLTSGRAGEGTPAPLEPP